MNVDQESAITDFLRILEEHRKNCEQQGKYVEAEIAKNRLDELRAHEEQRRRETMKARQIAERLGVEEAHMLEFQQFNKNWDTRLSEYEDNSKGLLKVMKERHAKQLMDLQGKMLAKHQQRPKFSTVLLNLRKIEEHLVRAKNYPEAQKMKVKADALEESEIRKSNKQRKKDNAHQENKFKAAKNQELNALNKRIESGRKELSKKRQNELERMLQRYQNVKNELEAQQNLERMKAVRSGSSGPFTLNKCNSSRV